MQDILFQLQLDFNLNNKISYFHVFVIVTINYLKVLSNSTAIECFKNCSATKKNYKTHNLVIIGN